jgi:hypothetical protein
MLPDSVASKFSPSTRSRSMYSSSRVSASGVAQTWSSEV